MQQELTRREAPKRGAMTAGALAWATPVLQIVGISPAHAHETSPGEGKDCCVDGDGNTVKSAVLVMEYLGGSNFCGGSDYTQDDSLVTCIDYTDPASRPDPAYIVASHREFPIRADGSIKPAARI